MIQQHEVMPILLQACPSFTPLWEAHLREYEGEVLFYIVMGELAHHMLELQQSGEAACFAALGVAIERLHAEGDAWVQELATIGLLEGIQNVWRNTGVDPAQFEPYLGPESQRAWHALNAFWSGQAVTVAVEGQEEAI